MTTRINVMVENLTSTDENAKVVLLENVEVDFDKLMKLLTGKPVARKPRQPRTPKAKSDTPSNDAIDARLAAPAPAPVKVETPAPAPASKPQKRRGGFRRRRGSNPVRVALTDCLGIGLYPTKQGPKRVAVWRKSDKQGIEILLWVEDNEEFASHDDGGFPNSQGKLYNVEWL